MVAQKVSLQGMVVGVEEEAFMMAIPNVGGGQPMVTLAMRGGVGGEQTGEERSICYLTNCEIRKEKSLNGSLTATFPFSYLMIIVFRIFGPTSLYGVRLMVSDYTTKLMAYLSKIVKGRLNKKQRFKVKKILAVDLKGLPVFHATPDPVSHRQWFQSPYLLPPATNQSRTTTESALPRYEQNRISLDHYSRWNQPKREKKPIGLPELSSHRSPFMFVRAFTRPSLCERRDRDLIFGLLGSSRSLRIFAGPLAALACVLTRR
ncbi:hypothetical protein NC653_039504 [Populus alba x Populus x berolinensis]|uniref:Uncharacterized protein n=1 Tax=Populus alba x Populus x berolinensis TaxID=444605 RepID=A0AAD6LBC6_9ROSI|nr:hypothetical protein NC653_039504 [Populus alba x Populus x berolinensis]